MATVAHESGHLVTFLAMPERQWFYVNEVAHELGVSAEQYVSLALSYFDRLPGQVRQQFVVANSPLPVLEDLDGDDGRAAGTD